MPLRTAKKLEKQHKILAGHMCDRLSETLNEYCRNLPTLRNRTHVRPYALHGTTPLKHSLSVIAAGLLQDQQSR